MTVQETEPVVEVVDEGEGVRDVVALRTEEEQHGQREILRTAKQTYSTHNQTQTAATKDV